MKQNNPYFSVEFSQEQVDEITKPLRKILTQDLELTIENLSNPHISLSYVLGNVAMSEIENVAQEISEAPFKMKVTGIDTIESSYYGGTIFSLSLAPSDDFLYAQEIIKESLTVDSSVTIREFEGGFRAHISLFVIKDLAEDKKFLISRYLEIATDVLSQKEIYGENLCMYNPEREKVLEKKFKS